MPCEPEARPLGLQSVKFNHVQKMGRGDRFEKTNILDISTIIELNNLMVNELKKKHEIPIYDTAYSFCQESSDLGLFPFKRRTDDLIMNKEILSRRKK